VHDREPGSSGQVLADPDGELEPAVALAAELDEAEEIRRRDRSRKTVIRQLGRVGIGRQAERLRRRP
jgi:hypothetical protein